MEECVCLCRTLHLHNLPQPAWPLTIAGPCISPGCKPRLAPVGSVTQSAQEEPPDWLEPPPNQDRTHTLKEVTAGLHQQLYISRAGHSEKNKIRRSAIGKVTPVVIPEDPMRILRKVQICGKKQLFAACCAESTEHCPDKNNLVCSWEAHCFSDTCYFGAYVTATEMWLTCERPVSSISSAVAVALITATSLPPPSEIFFFLSKALARKRMHPDRYV